MRCLDTSLDIDKKIGLYCYMTSENLYLEPLEKLSHENFVVLEYLKHLGLASQNYQPNYMMFSSVYDKLYLYILHKKDLDSLTAIKLMKKLFNSEKIYYLGLKDRSADTYQFIGVYKPRNFSVYLKKDNIETYFVGIYPKKLFSKKILLGNCFIITIPKLTSEEDRFREIIEIIKKIGYLPNYYSYQRFGVRRNITHLLGRYIIEDRIDELVNMMICYPHESCDICEKCKKIYVKKSWSWIERIICENLCIKKSSNMIELFKGVPRSIIRFYISAFFSYIFNLYVSKRWIKYGLVVENLDDEKLGSTYIGSKKLPYLMINVLKDGIKIYSGIKDLFEMIVQQNLEVSYKDLYMNIKRYTGLKRFVLKRFIISPVENIRIDRDKLYFCLDKGGYATNLLREIFKKNIVKLL